jgi:hypothetical protein
MTETTTESNTEPTACENPVVDAVRSIASAAGQDVTCDKAKGYLLMVGLAIVAIIAIKFFVLKK